MAHVSTSLVSITPEFTALLIWNSGPIFLDDAAVSDGTILLAAYIFSAGIITSAFVYWCIQRFMHGYMRNILRMEPLSLAIREVEDFFDELKQGLAIGMCF